MVFRQLVYLVALARERHFGRAAEACHVSQPGLSTALRQLEEDLGVPIILRTQRFKGFTPQGEVVLNFARRVLDECGTLRQELLSRSGALEGRLKIGVLPSAMPLLPLLTGPLCSRHPDISIEALSLTESDIQKQLVEFELDLGFTMLSGINLPNLRVTAPLFTERYVFLTPAHHPLAQRASVTLNEVAAAPLCLLKRTIHTRRVIDRLFAAAYCEPSPQIETDSILALCAHVRSGHWSTILPEGCLHPFGALPGTAAIPLRDAAGTEQVGLAMIDRSPLPPLVQAMLTVAADVRIADQLRQLTAVPPAARRAELVA
ncbi:LysR family transcriptional regulator [Pigmentiphaga soli]|uniref:LysR family transcriptional regulator n=1 Tax=Pigmentiphaga soli TaxID=1007095 RepID=A0ABP8H473_9BURK